jgi:PIN domain nuclease of toxin-antitoxin system
VPFVTDTHALIWHLTGDPRLSAEARRVFQNTDQGRETVHIPCILLFELSYLFEKKKVGVNIGNVVSLLRSSSNYRVEPMYVSVIQQSLSLSRADVPDPWDRLIAGTAIHLGFPLITRDQDLQSSGIKTLW